MDTDVEITVVSLPDREKLVAEIYYRSHQWAEISREAECLMLEIYANPEGGVWKFSLSVNRVETPAFRQAVFNTALDLS